jgi:uncharacterized protein (TIGR03435 family)
VGRTFPISTLSPWLKLACFVLLLCGIAVFAPAQLRFDAASIRLVTDSELRTRSGMGEKSPGTFFAENMPLHVLIQEAYGDNPDQSWVLQSMTGRQRASWESLRVLNEPEWVKSDRFDVMAKSVPVASAEARSRTQMIRDQSQMDLMLRALLEERLQLKTHRETKNLPIYELVVSKPGLLRQADCTTTCRTSEFGQKGLDLFIEGEAMNATELAGTISMVLDRPVFNKTGVAGTFDVHVQWTPDPGEVGDSDAASLGDSSGSIFTVLHEKLGLKLQRATGPVLVIDHVEKPTAN